VQEAERDQALVRIDDVLQFVTRRAQCHQRLAGGVQQCTATTIASCGAINANQSESESITSKSLLD
jgi:Leucine-rich repeat (LRR) protein